MTALLTIASNALFLFLEVYSLRNYQFNAEKDLPNKIRKPLICGGECMVKDSSEWRSELGCKDPISPDFARGLSIFKHTIFQQKLVKYINNSNYICKC